MIIFIGNKTNILPFYCITVENEGMRGEGLFLVHMDGKIKNYNLLDI